MKKGTIYGIIPRIGEKMYQRKTIKYDKETKKFFDKAKIKRDDSYDEVNEKIIAFIKKAGKRLNIDSVYLTERQLSDANFMLRLFQTNPKLNLVFSNFDIKLRHNQGFALKYLEIVLGDDMEGKSFTDYLLEFSKFKDLFNSVEFVKEIAKKFPKCNIVLVLYNIVGKGDQNSKRFTEIIKNLPTEILCEQAKKFGWETMYNLPKDTPDYYKILSSAVEKDGFKVLKYLDIDDVLEHKDLILKAYDKQGIEALSKYIEFYLNPKRVNTYAVGDRLKSEIIFDEKYAQVQKALLSDPDIAKIYSVHSSNLTWKDKRVVKKIGEISEEENENY